MEERSGDGVGPRVMALVTSALSALGLVFTLNGDQARRLLNPHGGGFTSQHTAEDMGPWFALILVVSGAVAAWALAKKRERRVAWAAILVSVAILLTWSWMMFGPEVLSRVLRHGRPPHGIL